MRNRVLMGLYLNIYGSFDTIQLWKRRIWYNIERYTFPCNYVYVITQVIFEQILIRVFIQYSNNWRKFYTSHLLEETLNSTWFSWLIIVTLTFVEIWEYITIRRYFYAIFKNCRNSSFWTSLLNFGSKDRSIYFK